MATLSSDPQSCGKQTATALSGNNRIYDTSAHTDWLNSGQSWNDFWAHLIQFYALAGNTGLVYIGPSTMDKATGVDVVLTLQPGDSLPIGSIAAQLNTLHVADWYFAVDTDGDGIEAYASVA